MGLQDSSSQSAYLDAGAPQGWSEILAPYLHIVLAHNGSYTDEEVGLHLQFFVEHITPWLGPGPVQDTVESSALYNPRYPSSMTNDFTPLELSCCWKSPLQQGKPIVRYVLDIAPANPDEPRASSLARALKAIAALKTVASVSDGSLQLDIFPELWMHVTKAIVEYEGRIRHSLCSVCGPSSTFIGFDLVKSRAKLKFYWLLPSCQTTPELLHMLDHIFRSSSAVDSCFASAAFVDAWQTIRNHIEKYPKTLCPRMLSIDATQYPSPRIKFYTRCLFPKSNTFDAFESHLTLDGQIDLSQDFLSTCRNLWMSLATTPKEWRPEVTGPKYCLLLYEISGTSSVSAEEQTRSDISSKLYIMCQEIPRRDSFIAEQILKHCRVVDNAPLLRSFALQKSPSAFITE